MRLAAAFSVLVYILLFIAGMALLGGDEAGKKCQAVQSEDVCSYSLK